MGQVRRQVKAAVVASAILEVDEPRNTDLRVQVQIRIGEVVVREDERQAPTIHPLAQPARLDGNSLQAQCSDTLGNLGALPNALRRSRALRTRQPLIRRGPAPRLGTASSILQVTRRPKLDVPPAIPQCDLRRTSPTRAGLISAPRETRRRSSPCRDRTPTLDWFQKRAPSTTCHQTPTCRADSCSRLSIARCERLCRSNPRRLRKSTQDRLLSRWFEHIAPRSASDSNCGKA
mmetsp:Transcript_92934/g.299051  ORF Transcript_92934/g.299051 Transcript_92934/m.299051 type:complete len:233 (+) Transcript_92934:374-1072(+)